MSFFDKINNYMIVNVIKEILKIEIVKTVQNRDMFEINWKKKAKKTLLPAEGEISFYEDQLLRRFSVVVVAFLTMNYLWQ